VVSVTQRPLYPQGDSPRYPTDRKLQVGSRVGLEAVAKIKKIPAPAGNQTPDVQSEPSHYSD